MNVLFAGKLICWHEIYHLCSITNLSEEIIQSICLSLSFVSLRLNTNRGYFPLRYHAARFAVNIKRGLHSLIPANHGQAPGSQCWSNQVTQWLTSVNHHPDELKISIQNAAKDDVF